MKPETEKHFVEIVAGCVWLTQDGLTTGDFAKRGLWDTKEEAAEALFESMQDEGPTRQESRAYSESIWKTTP